MLQVVVFFCAQYNADRLAKQIFKSNFDFFYVWVLPIQMFGFNIETFNIRK